MVSKLENDEIASKGKVLNGFTKTVLFVSSYAPLLTIFWLLESFGPTFSVVAGLLAGVGVLLLIAVWLVLTRSPSVDLVSFSDARNRDADVMAYVVTYVVPFAAAASAIGTAGQVALVFFAILIGVLYVRSSVFYVHPLLLMVGIHVYEVHRGGIPSILLTRRRHVRQAEQFKVIEIGTNVYVEKRSSQ